MPAPPGRWFAFRLRTLFVLVAVVAVPLALGAWVGDSLQWIKQRRQFVAVRAVDVSDSAYVAASQLTCQLIAIEPAPGGLWLLGEHGRYLILVKSPADFPLAKRLFPEARVDMQNR